jgi:hypothetical protein
MEDDAVVMPTTNVFEWPEDKRALCYQARMLGWSFAQIGMLIDVPANVVHVVCEREGWTVPLAQWEAEWRRVTSRKLSAAAASLTGKGHEVRDVGEGLYRLDGAPLRAAALLDAAGL